MVVVRELRQGRQLVPLCVVIVLVCQGAASISTPSGRNPPPRRPAHVGPSSSICSGGRKGWQRGRGRGRRRCRRRPSASRRRRRRRNRHEVRIPADTATYSSSSSSSFPMSMPVGSRPGGSSPSDGVAIQARLGIERVRRRRSGRVRGGVPVMMRMLHQRWWRGWIVSMRRRRRGWWIAEGSAAASRESGWTFGAPAADRTGIKARIAFLVVDESTVRRRRQRQRQQIGTNEASTIASTGIKVAGTFKVVVFIVRRGSSDRSGDGGSWRAGIVASFARTARDGPLFGAVLARPPPLRFERPRPLLLFRFRPVRVCARATIEQRYESQSRAKGSAVPKRSSPLSHLVRLG